MDISTLDVKSKTGKRYTVGIASLNPPYAFSALFSSHPFDISGRLAGWIDKYREANFELGFRLALRNPAAEWEIKSAISNPGSREALSRVAQATGKRIPSLRRNCRVCQ
jgi:hypothetical protein